MDRTMRWNKPAALCLLLITGWLPPQAIAAEQPAFSAEDIAFFENKIRPVLAEKCYSCHSVKAEKLKGGLLLDSRKGVIKGGDFGPAIEPGKPDDSLFIEAIKHLDPELAMPPKEKLSPKVIADFERWIKLGAPWPKEAPPSKDGKKEEGGIDVAARKADHWAWQPIKPVAAPSVKHKDWPRDAIDRFVLAKMESKGLKPAADADRRVWLRRVTYDLIGLPPKPEDIAKFLDDKSPDAEAKAKVVDRLLASRHFGERWARHWMDLVRYAESRGHEFDYDVPNPWRYRDYLIRAFNDDVPFDQFVIEHIAGDLLEKPRMNPEKGFNESILGTGFWFLGEWVHSPVDIKLDEADRYDNMIDVMGKAFLGITLGCARCHDHKFDPITAADVYALHGFLQSSNYRLARFETLDHNRKIAEQLASHRADAQPKLYAAVANAIQPNVQQLPKYLIAAGEVIAEAKQQAKLAAMKTELDALVDESRPAKPAKPIKPGADVVVFDFEDGKLDGWERTGTAFGDGAVTHAMSTYSIELKGFIGKRFINSHRGDKRSNPGQRDAHKGRLKSPAFKIDRNHLSFWIAGGKHAKKTAVNLLVDGKVVRSATGHNSGNFRADSWNVAPLQGKSAQIEIVDEVAGGWGHIMADHFVLTNNPAASSKKAQRKNGKQKASKNDPATKPLVIDAKLVAPIAQKHGLDAALLKRWAEHLISDIKPDDPFHLAAQVLAHGKAPARLADGLRQREQDKGVARSEEAKALKDALVVVDYRQPDATMIQDGFSFRHVAAGDLRLGSAKPQGTVRDPRLRVFDVGAVQRDPAFASLRVVGSKLEPGRTNWDRSGKMVRTPTFTLQRGKLRYLVRGSFKAYLVVDSHRTNNGPLHGRLIRKSKGDDQTWRWDTHDLLRDMGRYGGHNMHVEFTAEGDSDFAVAMVVQSETMPANPLATPSETMASLFSASRDADAMAKAYGQAATEAVDAMSRNKLGESRDTAAFADALLRRLPLLHRDADSLVKPWLDKHRAIAGQVKSDSAVAMAMMDGTPVDEHVMIRGSHKRLGKVVPRRFLEMYSDLKPSQGDAASVAKANQGKQAKQVGSGRLALAKRLVDPRMPLTSRVIVNRVWHHMFGRGIVASVDDFGKMGAPPTHPQLLDTLADDFMKDGWSLKRLIRRVALSRTYGLSSDKPGGAAGDRLAEIDGGNDLLSYARVRRLQAEAIRDGILAVSGELKDKEFGGESVNVYLTPFMEGRGRPKGGPLDGNGRRSVYIAIRRNFLPAMMLAFDMPAPFNSMGRRTTSNVPAQALILMNDPFVLAQAKKWGQSILAGNHADDKARIRHMYVQAYARPAADDEVYRAVAFMKQQGQRYGLNEEQAMKDARVWADLAHVLFNVKEFVFLN